MRRLVLIALLALSACSSDDDDSEPTTSTSAATSSSSSSSSSTSSSSTSSTVALRAPGDTGRGSFSFRMPSGNIHCSISEEVARCDITDKTWTPPPKPADCDLDWGDSIWVDKGDAGFACVGDTVQDEQSVVLPYGGIVERGELRCRSEEAGVTCEHRARGHRFLLSRERYQLS